MFEHMKDINKLVSKKIMDIENSVTKSESIFVDEINKLLKNKLEITRYEKKSQYINEQGNKEFDSSFRQQTQILTHHNH